jgi:alkylation response protein AidB-like acyl-CoA dehydrogenase
MWSSLIDAAPDTSQDDVIALLEASVEVFLRREPDLFESGSAWRVCREFGLFSLLGSAPDSLGFSLTAYARLLVSVSRMNGQLAFAVAQANQARLLSESGGGPDEDRFEAAVLARPGWGAGTTTGACLRFESAIPPAALDTQWIALPSGGDGCLPSAISAPRVEDLRLNPLTQGSARYSFVFRPESLGWAALGAAVAVAARHRLAAKQFLDEMAISQGQLWRGYELALSFCDERYIFNRRLTEFQNVRAKLADIYAHLRVLSSVIAVACVSGQTHRAGRLELLAAIHRRLALRVATELMQAFGGTAFMEDSGMPEIYSNVVRLSLGALWSFPPTLAMPAERLAREVADLMEGRLADAGAGEFWRTAVLCVRDGMPGGLRRTLELTGLCLALERVGVEDDGCGGALRDYWEHAVTAGALRRRSVCSDLTPK